MSVSGILGWVEASALSQWIVGDLFAFPVILTMHAVGMGFAAGLGVMIALRVLGVGRSIPIAELRRFLPLLWAGFWLNAVSGVLLLIGYPTKALTNPVFYLKLSLIGAAMLLLGRISRSIVDRPDTPRAVAAVLPERTLRRLALVSLVCWAGAITAGRLLAYTYWYFTAGDLLVRK